MPLMLLWMLACGEPPAPPPTPAAEAVEAPTEAVADAPEPAGPANRPPKVGEIVFTPPEPRVIDDITVSVVGEDPDGDFVDVDLTWVINDQLRVELPDGQLSAGTAKRGDTLALEIALSDGFNKVTVRSTPVTVANSAPEILNRPDELTDLNRFQLRATDPDGDSLRYRLEGEPAGMSIDEEGALHYQGSEDEPGGAYEVSIVAEDRLGGFARWPFQINVSPGHKKEKVAREDLEKASR